MDGIVFSGQATKLPKDYKKIEYLTQPAPFKYDMTTLIKTNDNSLCARLVYYLGCFDSDIILLKAKMKDIKIENAYIGKYFYNNDSSESDTPVEEVNPPGENIPPVIEDDDE